MARLLRILHLLCAASADRAIPPTNHDRSADAALHHEAQHRLVTEKASSPQQHSTDIHPDGVNEESSDKAKRSAGAAPTARSRGKIKSEDAAAAAALLQHENQNAALDQQLILESGLREQKSSMLSARKLQAAFDGKPRPKEPNAFLPMSRREGMEYAGVRNLTKDHVYEQIAILLLAFAVTGLMIFGLWYVTDRVNLTHPPNEVRVDPYTGEDLPRPFQFLRDEDFQDKVAGYMETFRENNYYLSTVLFYHLGQSLLFVIKVYDVRDEIPWYVLLLEAVLGLLLFVDPFVTNLQCFIMSEFGTLEKLKYKELATETIALIAPMLSLVISRQHEYDKEAGNYLADPGNTIGTFWFSFRYFGCIRLRKYYLLLFPEMSSVRSPVARASYAVILRFFEVFIFFYVVVSTLWVVEFAEGLFPRLLPQANNWTLDASLWFVTTSAMTIGYGDYAPVTFFGRLVTMIFLVSVLLLVGLIADLLSKMLAETASGQGRYVVKSRVPYVICVGNFSPATAKSVLAEYFHDDQHAVHRDRMEMVFVLVGQQFNGVAQAVGEWCSENQDYSPRVHVFRGNITSTYDYRRCGVATAKAVLVVPNVQNPVDKQKEDVDSLLRVQAVQKRSPPNLQVIVILHLMRNRYMFLGIIPRRNLICADDFKFRLLGRVNFLPGLPSLLCSLLQCSSMSDNDRSLFKQLESSYQEDTLSKNQFMLFHDEELHYGQGKELYAITLNPSYAKFAPKAEDMPWSCIVRDVLYRSKNKDVLLLGYIRYDPAADTSYLKYEKEVIFFPPDYDLAFSHPTKTKVLGIFIASDAFDIRQRPSMDVFTLPEVDSDEEEFDEAAFDAADDEDKETEESDLEMQPALAGNLSFKSESDKTVSERALTKHEIKMQRLAVLAGVDPPDLSQNYSKHEKIKAEKAPPKVYYRRKIIEKQLQYLRQHEISVDNVYEIGRRAFADRYLNNPRARSQLKPGENNLPFDFEGDHFLYCLCGPAAVGLSLSVLLQNLALGLEEDGPDYSDDEWGQQEVKVYSKQESGEAMDMRMLEQMDEEQSESAMSLIPSSRKRLRKIVLVVLSKRKPLDWDDALALARENPHLIPVWVKGSPTKMLDLERCSFRRARVIYVQGFPTRPTDGECIFCTRLIESTIGTDSMDPMLPIVVPELTLEANFRYVPLGLSPKVDHQVFEDAMHAKRKSFMRSQESYAFTSNALAKQPFTRSARYSAGRLYVSSMLTSLAVNQVFNPDLGTLIQIMSDALMVVEISNEYVGQPYGKLWKFLLSQRLLAVGLLRNAVTMAKTLGAATALGLVSHEFPICAPPKDDVLLQEGDRVYVMRHGLLYTLDS
ncbi:unnamed protein product [Amoebophrya sp. A120]|nr:unnamed protein product [Amoebophrya sp. A120]|eukprot:GSA120T00011455001.1